MAIFPGTAGSDILSGTVLNDIFRLFEGGDDTANGDAGNDIFYMRAALNAADRIDGGAGSDKVSLDGDYSAGLVFDADTIKNIGTLSFAAGYDYDLTTNDGNVAAGGTLSLLAGSLGAGNSLTFDGSAELDGKFRISAGAGNDTLTGGAQRDVFHLETGGDDTANGGGGNDAFFLGGSFDAADRIDGGAGADTATLDGLGLKEAIILDAATLAGIETLNLKDGVYAITTNDGNVAAGETLTVEGAQVTGGWTFDGAAETDGAFAIAGGDGDDDFTGGAGDDAFTGGLGEDVLDLSHGGADTANGGGGDDRFRLGAALTAADTINGGGGTQDVLRLRGDYAGGNAVAFGATTMLNVETVRLSGGSMNFATHETTVAAGATLFVDGGALDSSQALTFNGAAETDGAFAVTGGAGNDNITGGAGDDTVDLSLGGIDTATGGGGDDRFRLGAALTAADSINGGAGTQDVVRLDGDYAGGNAVVFGATTLSNVETMGLSGGSMTLTTHDATVASGAKLVVDGGALDGSQALNFNGAAETDGAFAITAGAGNDNLTGGAGADSFDLSHGGNDIANGDGANDTFSMGGALTAADTINGGTGTDTLNLAGDYAGEVVFGATTLTGVENIGLAAGYDYRLTTHDNTVAAGATLAVNGSALGAGDVLTFNGAAETDGRFIVIGGAANDAMRAGAGDDIFDLSRGGDDTALGDGGNDRFRLGAALTSADTIGGGGGQDLLTLDGDYAGGNAVAFGATTVLNVETMRLSGGGMTLTTHDATVAAGATLTVDGRALDSSQVLTFNGAAETNGRFIVTGGDGNDRFAGGAGNDKLNGGDGSDAVDYSASAAAITVNLLAGTATGAGSDSLSSIEDVIGSGHADRITVSSVANVILAGAGDDLILIANAADAVGDTLDGGSGINDRIRFTSTTAGETLTLDSGTTGVEQVTISDELGMTTGTKALNVDVSAVVGDISVTGNDGDNVLTGNASVNAMTGGDGADTIDAGADSDTVGAGDGDDTVIGTADSASDIYNGGSGIDWINYSALTTGQNISVNLQTGTASGVAIGSDTLSGPSFENVSAGGGDDSLIGSLANNTIRGDGGADSIVGGGGSDTLFGGIGNDTLNGGVNDFSLTPAAANDFLFGGGGSDTFRFEGHFGNDQIGASGTPDWTDGEDIVLAGYAGAASLIVDIAGGALIVVADNSVLSTVTVWGATAAELDVNVSGLDLIIG